jgi:hypothetical protein
MTLKGVFTEILNVEWSPSIGQSIEQGIEQGIDARHSTYLLGSNQMPGLRT